MDVAQLPIGWGSPLAAVLGIVRIGLVVAALSMVEFTGVCGAQAAGDVVADGQSALSAAVTETAAKAAQHFAAREYQELWGMVAPLLQDKITVAQLQAIGDQLGAAQAVGQPQPVLGHPQTAIVALTYPAVTIDLTVTVDEQGRLIGLFVSPHRQPAAPSAPPSGSPEGPPYAVSGAFAERTATFGAPGWELGATFTYPTERHEYPAVVLVHGSGPHDRDETIGPNHVFRDLAWGLASRGIAVFRYDKRTFVYGAKMAKTPAAVTPNSEVVDDARAAVAWVKQQPGVNRVYLLGHSLGAQLAPAIAAGLPAGTLAGLVLLAAPVQPLDQLLLYQARYIAQVDGVVTPEEESGLVQLQAAVQALVSGQLPADADFLGAPVHYWLQLRELQPLPIVQRLDLPMLFVQGGRDYQVPATELAVWQRALDASQANGMGAGSGNGGGSGSGKGGGSAEGSGSGSGKGDGSAEGSGSGSGKGGGSRAARARVEFRLFPDLNHLLMAGPGVSTPQEYEKPGHVAPEVIEAISRFIVSA